MNLEMLFVTASLIFAFIAIVCTNIRVSRESSQEPNIVECVRWLGPLVFHAAAKDAMITPGVDVRGVLDAMVEKVPADAEGKVPTGYGVWCATWPDNPARRFVAVGVGHGVEQWTAFPRALAAENLRAAAPKM